MKHLIICGLLLLGPLAQAQEVFLKLINGQEITTTISASSDTQLFTKNGTFKYQAIDSLAFLHVKDNQLARVDKIQTKMSSIKKTITTKGVSYHRPKWKVEDMKLLWSYVYTKDSLSSTEIISRLQHKFDITPGFTIDKITTAIVYGQFEKQRMDVKKLAKSDYGAATINGIYSGQYKIQIKNGRYKVEVYEISIFGKSTDLGFVILSGATQYGTYQWNDLAIRKNGDISKSWQQNLNGVQSNFLDWFDISNEMTVEELDSDF